MTTGSAVTEARRPKTINILPAELVNQIAAGEVIERPASVVKELVENALDAGARRLTIDLESGGMDLIRVTDDGCGILEAELPLAVQNHATSKLQSLSDLFAIASLGFRGEALASIASISQFRLASRTADADGAELAVDGGKLGATQPVALPIGTRVEVRNLFFNVPARRKFLKSDRSEIAAVTQQLTRLALSRPDVFITLRNDGKQILTVPPSDEPRERIARLTTQVVAEEILAVGPIDAKKVTMSLRGYVSPFNLTRADTRGQFFFLNNRSIRDPLLLSAVKDSYLHLLPPRRHPWVFLWLDVEPEDVDVNVHPTKSEVRFRYSSDVYALIVSSIKSALSSLAEAPMLTGGSASERAPVTLAPPPRPSNEFSFPMRGDVIEQMGQGPGRAAAADLKPRSAEMPFRSASERSFELRVNPGPRPSFAFPERGSGFEAKIPEESAAPREGASEEELCDDPSCSPSVPSDDRAFASTPGEANSSVDPGPAPVSRLNPFFQIHNAFIVEETREGVKIIDQHALHERILYHQIVQRLAAGRLETQRLLFSGAIRARDGGERPLS
jgi:DNA mismatch repair protein MutL